MRWQRLGVTKQCVHTMLAGTEIVMKAGLYCRDCEALLYRGDIIMWTGQTVLCLACLKETPEATFAERLKSVRVAKGMSQTELAEKSKLSASSIRKYETGVVMNPAFETLRRLVKVLGPALVCD